MPSVNSEYERKKRWREENPELHRANVNDWKRNNKGRNSLIKYKSRIKMKYGIGLDDVESLRETQEDKCPICMIGFEASTSEMSPFVIDHCHETGKVRGLLCPKCNRGLGHFSDNPELLERAISYLRCKV